MSRRQLTERRRAYGHLFGIDRHRVIAVYSDGQRVTESFDAVTLADAQRPAATLMPPRSTEGAPVVRSVEIHLGQWRPVGQLDAEWSDLRPIATCRVINGAIGWTDTTAPNPDPLSGDQRSLF